MAPIQLINEASPIIASIGGAFYFNEATISRGKALGLDGFRFYMLGRCGVLGDVEADVVESAMGYFSKATVQKIWNSAKDILPPREAGHQYMLCNQNFGMTKFSNLSHLNEYVAATKKIIDAQERSSLALFSGIAAEPVPKNPAAAAMQVTSVLREMRGSIHLSALFSSGITAEMAHRVKRPNETSFFGWEDGPNPTEDDRSNWEKAEALTNDLLIPAWSAVSDTEGDLILSTVTNMQAILAN